MTNTAFVARIPALLRKPPAAVQAFVDGPRIAARPACPSCDIDKSERTAIMLYDSGYAANMVAGRWQPNTNTNVVQWARGLLAEVEKSRTVHWVHVKGHSGDGGNDRADELVQWGKEEGPYARLRALGAGEGDSRFGAAIRENSSLGSEKRVDSRGNGELHMGH